MGGFFEVGFVRISVRSIKRLPPQIGDLVNLKSLNLSEVRAFIVDFHLSQIT